jgi:general secretion pathway protein H
MTPTSATGDEAGFTLVEMLVTLVVVGLLTSVALVSFPDARPSLASEADRFAARLVRAREEAIITNRTIEVRVSPQGYDFTSNRGGDRQPLDGKAFASVSWSEETAVTAGGGGLTRIAFDATGLTNAATIDLVRERRRMRVSIDDGGEVSVDAPR